MSKTTETTAVTGRLGLTDSDLAEILGISRSHIWTMHSAGRLPRPIRLGRAVRWNRREIEAWMEAGAPSRDAWEAKRPGGHR